MKSNKREFEVVWKSSWRNGIFLKTTYMSEYWPIAQTVDWAADSVHHIQQSEAAGRRCCKTPTRRAGGKYAETKLGSFMIPRFMFWWGNHTRVCSVSSAGCWYLAGVTTLHPPPPPEQQVSSFTWFHHNHLPPARPAPPQPAPHTPPPLTSRIWVSLFIFLVS